MILIESNFDKIGNCFFAVNPQAHAGEFQGKTSGLLVGIPCHIFPWILPDGPLVERDTFRNGLMFRDRPACILIE
jgi:hypothetical protein